jgi:hypothetical protein
MAIRLNYSSLSRVNESVMESGYDPQYGRKTAK